MISPDINSNTSRYVMNDPDMETIGGSGDFSELSRLKEKVRALERQNEMLKQTKNGDSAGDGAVDGAAARPRLSDEKIIDDIKLLEIEDLDDSEENWLLDVSRNQEEEEDECAWLRKDVMSPNSLAAARKKSLVNKLDDIAKSK